MRFPKQGELTGGQKNGRWYRKTTAVFYEVLMLQISLIR